MARCRCGFFLVVVNDRLDNLLLSIPSKRASTAFTSSHIQYRTLALIDSPVGRTPSVPLGFVFFTVDSSRSYYGTSMFFFFSLLALLYGTVQSDGTAFGKSYHATSA